MLRVYVYMDDFFIRKTDVQGPNNSPIIDLRMKVTLPSNAQEIRLDMYDCQNLTPEELQDLDKIEEDSILERYTGDDNDDAEEAEMRAAAGDAQPVQLGI